MLRGDSKNRRQFDFSYLWYGIRINISLELEHIEKHSQSEQEIYQ